MRPLSFIATPTVWPAVAALVVGVVLVGLAMSMPPAAAQTGTGIPLDPRLTRGLFLDGPRDAQTGRFPTPNTDPTIRRGRSVLVDWRLLGLWESGGVARMRLNLFGDADFPTALVRTVRRGPNSVSYAGRLDGEADSHVQIVVREDAMAAVVQIPRRNLSFRVEKTAAGIHRVIEENLSAFPECATGPGQHVELPRPLGFDPVPASDPPVVDVLMLYTNVTSAAAGGTASMEAQAQLGIDVSNTAYANSGIETRLRLAGAQEVTYDEVGTFSEHLTRLTDTKDGVLDNVAALREQAGADMVALIVEDNDACGIGWVMDTLTPQFEPYAVSVVNRACSASYWSLAHELGHNMGCFHDRDNSGAIGTPIQPWAYGHRFTGTDGVQYRTIMSYAPGRRIPHFSNPDILYAGAPTGVPHGQPGAADNTAVINTTASLIASFAGPPPPPVPYSLADVTRALGLAAGLAAPDATDLARLNTEGALPGITMEDAVRLTRKSAGLDPNP